MRYWVLPRYTADASTVVKKIKGHMKVKEVVIDEGECSCRFILAFNLEEEKKDRTAREKNLG